VTPFFRSFYGKLSSIFLVLVLALGAASLLIAYNATGTLFDEVEQVLNREYAGSIALELEPLLSEGFSETVVKDAIHYMMVLNPNVEIYLLDGEGRILAFFALPGDEIVRDRVDVQPLEVFISTEGRIPVLGDDPRTVSRVKPFSAAPLGMGPNRGYVYVILRGQGFDRSLSMQRGDFFIRTGLVTFLVALLATLAAGLALFFLLTRPLTKLGEAVRAFEDGDLSRRLPVRGRDELGSLARAFNDMAASLQAGVKQRSELIANISHDLRSPLTTIRANLETMQLKGQGNELLEATLRNVGSFQRLVEELFDLAKLETGQVAPNLEPTNLAELTQDVVLKLKPRAETAGISMIAEFSDGLPFAPIDTAMMERVLTNIIDNAMAHVPEGGTIWVSVSPYSEGVIAQIKDTGPGIAPDDLPRVFERFYRADKSRSRRSPGTGLGLAIAKEIVDLHRGTIGVESFPGEGARFTVWLPRVKLE
jgi:signal transduction histidine kinase